MPMLSITNLFYLNKKTEKGRSLLDVTKINLLCQCVSPKHIKSVDKVF